VVGEINAVCGACAACVANRRTHCERRTVLGIVNRHGAFAESLILPVDNLHAVPDDVPDEVALFTEPLAAALEIQEQVAVGPGVRIVVVGDGKLGQLIGRSLALTGCELLVAGRHEAKLALLASGGIVTARPEGITAGQFDVAVECTGNPEGFALARRALRPRGTLVMKSTYAGRLSVDVSSLVVDEITLVGSRCGPFAPALIAGRYALRDALAAFEHAQKPGVLKILLEVQPGE
jgi:threonine dehydrogenase-like Zn-dependent dehydrogenase